MKGHKMTVNLKSMIMISTILCVSEIIHAQTMVRYENDGKSLIIMELPGVDVEKSAGITVDTIFPNAISSQTLDVKVGDVVRFINGELVKTVKDIKEKYEAIKVDEEFKLGIRRGDTSYIISLKKKEKQQPMQIMRTVDAEGKEKYTTPDGKKIDVEKLQKESIKLNTTESTSIKD